MDYVSVSSDLMLDGSTTRSCLNITIEDDAVLEPVEEFVVMLTEQDPRVMVDRDQAMVEITDNDGKSHSYLALLFQVHESMYNAAFLFKLGHYKYVILCNLIVSLHDSTCSASANCMKPFDLALM